MPSDIFEAYRKGYNDGYQQAINSIKKQFLVQNNYDIFNGET